MKLKNSGRSGTKSTKKENLQYALISVSDKQDIATIAGFLHKLGYRIIATGGTAKTLATNVPIIPIADITGNPESFDGRMKTISFQIEGGILYDRKNPSHNRQAKAYNIPNITIVIANLYPFEQTVKNENVSLKEAIESIDVGGPTMVRAAAKNFKHVLVVVDPSDYIRVIETLEKGLDDVVFRQMLAAKAFDHLAFYDAQIARFLRRDTFPKEMALPARFAMQLKYGENPHQKAAFYIEPNTNSPLSKLQKLEGRELSYVNLTDIAAGLESVRMFRVPAAVVIKHNSPSGIALGKTTANALSRAVEADPQSAFGGVVILNQTLDLQTAKTFGEFKENDGVVIDIIAAPRVSPSAKEFIKQIRKSTGIYEFRDMQKERSNKMHVKFVDGGFVMQEWDDVGADLKKWEVVTNAKPTVSQLKQMKIAWEFIGRIRSNTVIVVDKNLPMTRGIGSGQTSRVRATTIALEQAGEHAKGAILASDSFFPFDDSVILAVKNGIGAIIQQGGSRNDSASIAAANLHKIPMVFTHQRKFWH